MDLAAGEIMVAAQFTELIPHRRAVLEDAEAISEGSRPPIASVRLRGFPHVCGRVVAARYSRRTCRLINNSSFAARPMRAARALSWNGAPSIVAYVRTFEGAQFNDQAR